MVPPETSKLGTPNCTNFGAKNAKGLYPMNVKTFFDNLIDVYVTHNYTPDRIWNVDGMVGAIVIASKGTRQVYIITPNKWEHVSVLNCINARGALFLTSIYSRVSNSKPTILTNVKVGYI